MKKKPKDIKVSDIVIGFGIITKVDITYNDPFWEAPHWTYFDINDPYHGRCSTRIDPDKEYEIRTNPKQITRLYRDVDNALVECIKDREEERDLLKSLDRAHQSSGETS